MINLVGKRFGQLTVLALLPLRHKNIPQWECACACGEHLVVKGPHLRYGKKVACGNCTQQKVQEWLEAEAMRRVTLKKKPLQERIASACAADNISAGALERLIADVQAGLLLADKEVAATEAQAEDPSVFDPNVRQALHAAIWKRDKLQAASTTLQKRYQQVRAQERKIRWSQAADVVEQERDALTAEVSKSYPALIGKLMDLFERVKQMDHEVARINGDAPNDAGRRVDSVGVRADIAPSTRLVDLSGKPVWPPTPPPILPEQVMPVLPHPGADWWEANEQRDRQRHADAVRIANYYANQTKEREDRERAEAQARLRNGGGGP